MRQDLSILLVSSLLATFLPAKAQELSPAQVIPISQSEVPILYASDFAIAEDGVIFIPDGKDGNIKCYEPDGTLLKVIGRRGPGPGELRTPDFCDYQAPFFSVLDAFKIHIYERKGRAELVKIAEISCMACTSDVILSGKGVLVDAYVHYKDGKFCLTLRSFDDNVKHLLPNYRRYGFKSEGEHRTSFSTCSIAKDAMSRVSTSNLRKRFLGKPANQMLPIANGFAYGRERTEDELIVIKKYRLVGF